MKIFDTARLMRQNFIKDVYGIIPNVLILSTEDHRELREELKYVTARDDPARIETLLGMRLYECTDWKMDGMRVCYDPTLTKNDTE